MKKQTKKILKAGASGIAGQTKGRARTFKDKKREAKNNPEWNG